MGDQAFDLGALRQRDVIEVQCAHDGHAVVNRPHDLRCKAANGPGDRDDDDFVQAIDDLVATQDEDGPSLVGLRDRYQRISPRRIEVFPAVGIPRERLVGAGELTVGGRDRDVLGRVMCRRSVRRPERQQGQTPLLIRG